MSIKIKGARPDKTHFQSGKIIFAGKLKIKQPTPTQGLYPRNDLFPNINLYPKSGS